MQILPAYHADRTYTYTQVAREGDIAVYRQCHKRSAVVRYETIIIQRNGESHLPSGTILPMREVYPRASQWGIYGWTFFSQDAAEQKMRSLLD